MDYKNIYYNIIENAKKETIAGNRDDGYYEKHHIIPKSLGGTNKKENLVKLSAREHFICHWLLVKMYDKGTIERKKMLYALWRMYNKGAPKQTEHYINSRAYESLRIEFSKNIAEMNSINQQGDKNSHFGFKWYTNRNTGETRSFKEKPLAEYWIEGRNLFNGQSEKLNIKHNDTRRKIAQNAWDLYHSGNYSNMFEFRKEHPELPQISRFFETWIPLYNKIKIKIHGHGYRMLPDKNYIGKYE